MSRRSKNTPDNAFSIILICPLCGKTGGRGNDITHAKGTLKNHKRRIHNVTEKNIIQFENTKTRKTGNVDVTRFLDALGLLIEESKHVKY